MEISETDLANFIRDKVALTLNAESLENGLGAYR